MYDLLKRFVSQDDLQPGVLAEYDSVKNLLRINRDFWERATERERVALWRCKTIVELSNKR